MIAAFTKSQLMLLNIFFEEFKIKDGITKFDNFTKSYKKPVKKRPPLDPQSRCHALKKDKSRCNGRKIGAGQLCGIHIAKGINYGLAQDYQDCQDRQDRQDKEFSDAVPDPANEVCATLLELKSQ